MTDRYADLRAALDTMAQFGGWHRTRSHINIDESDDWCSVQIDVRANSDASRRVSGYLKESCPDAVRALLAERDRLREALAECVRVIQLDRDSLRDTHTDPATGQVEDRLGREGLAEYDAVLEIARAALAQEHGESDGTD